MAATMTDSAMRRAVSRFGFVTGVTTTAPDDRFEFPAPVARSALTRGRVVGRIITGRPARLGCGMLIGPCRALMPAGHPRHRGIVPGRGRGGKNAKPPLDRVPG